MEGEEKRISVKADNLREVVSVCVSPGAAPRSGGGDSSGGNRVVEISKLAAHVAFASSLVAIGDVRAASHRSGESIRVRACVCVHICASMPLFFLCLCVACPAWMCLCLWQTMRISVSVYFSLSVPVPVPISMRVQIESHVLCSTT